MQAQHAFADPESSEEELALVYGDRDTVSIVTGDQLSLRRAPAVATVITAAMIEEMGATDLDQVLQSVPGLHVSRASNTWSPLYILRGVYHNFNPQTLMLLNGTPVTTGLVGNKGNIWGRYPVSHIARIEIIRGPGSALYGADAFSGVINIITKGPAELNGSRAGLRVGSNRTRNAFAQHGGSAADVEYALFASRYRTDGPDARIEADAQTRNDTIFGSKVSLAPGRIAAQSDGTDLGTETAWGKWRWRAGYKYRNVGSGSGVAQALDVTGSEVSKRVTSELSWADPQWHADWAAGATLAYMNYKQQFKSPLALYPPGARFPTGVFTNGMLGAPGTSERTWRASAFLVYSGWDNHRLRLGAGIDDLNMYAVYEVKNFTFLSNGLPVPAGEYKPYTGALAFMTPQRRKVRYAYVQDEWQLGKDWALTAGVRHDRYSDTGSTTNPRIALVWDASVDVTAKLLYGHAFRAPAFNELYSINNPIAIGNPSVRPETVRSSEAAVTWQPARNARVNFNVFYYAMSDILRLTPNVAAGTGQLYANTPGQHGRGAELEGQWELSRQLSLTGGMSWQRSTDDRAAVDAGYAPHRKLYARAEWRIDRDWMLAPQLHHVGGRARPPGDLRKPIGDYTALDLALRYGAGKGPWRVSASIHNLTDADIREPSQAPGLNIPNDLPQGGRTFSLQAEYNF
jgi:iron complex outermembrane receptor protein